MAALGVRANTVTLGAASGAPGSEVALAISMTGAEAVTAMEVRVPLGGAATYVDGSAAVAERAAGFAIQAAQVDGELRLYLYSPTLAAISGSDGDVATFRLELAPTAGTFALTPTAVLSNAAGERVECAVSSGSVDVRAPRLEIRTAKVNYGHVPIRSVYHSTVAIANTGNEPMEVTGMEAAHESLTVSPATATIEPGGVKNFDVAFAPEQRGALATSIAVQTNAVNAKQYMRWLEVEVEADPYSVNELHVVRAEGESGSAVAVTLSMNNMEPIVAAQIQLQLPKGIDYVDGSVALSDRSAGHVVSAAVQDQLLTIVAYSPDNKPFSGDDGALLTFEVMLNNQSGWYTITPKNVVLSNAMMEDMTSATYSEYAVIKSPTIYGPATLDFGQQPVTETLTAQYTLRNSGEASLTVERVTFLAEGFSVATPLPIEVAVGKSAVLDVEYRTDVWADFATTMNIYSNDPTARMKAVAVSGRGYSPNTLTLAGACADGCYRLDVGMDNHAGISAVQFDLVAQEPEAVTEAIEVALTDRTAGFSAMASMVEAGRYRVVLYNVGNKPIEGNAGSIAVLTLPVGETVCEATFMVENMVLSAPASVNLTSPGATASATVEAYAIGDANGDGRASIADVSAVFNHILGFDNEYVNLSAADATGDGKITMSDVTEIFNIIINGK